MPLIAPRRDEGDDAGITLVLFALALSAMLVMAAFTVDFGLAYNDRTQDQIATDAAAKAGGYELSLATTTPRTVLNPLLGDQALADDIYERVTDIAFRSLNTNGTLAEWRARWDDSACSDPERPVDYSPIIISDGSPIDCISYRLALLDDPQAIRVRLPTTTVNTHTGRLAGVQSISSSAVAAVSVRAPDTPNMVVLDQFDCPVLLAEGVPASAANVDIGAFDGNPGMLAVDQVGAGCDSTNPGVRGSNLSSAGNTDGFICVGKTYTATAGCGLSSGTGVYRTYLDDDTVIVPPSGQCDGTISREFCNTQAIADSTLRRDTPITREALDHRYDCKTGYPEVIHVTNGSAAFGIYEAVRDCPGADGMTDYLSDLKTQLRAVTEASHTGWTMYGSGAGALPFYTGQGTGNAALNGSSQCDINRHNILGLRSGTSIGAARVLINCPGGLTVRSPIEFSSSVEAVVVIGNITVSPGYDCVALCALGAPALSPLSTNFGRVAGGATSPAVFFLNDGYSITYSNSGGLTLPTFAMQQTTIVIDDDATPTTRGIATTSPGLLGILLDWSAPDIPVTIGASTYDLRNLLVWADNAPPPNANPTPVQLAALVDPTFALDGLAFGSTLDGIVAIPTIHNPTTPVSTASNPRMTGFNNLAAILVGQLWVDQMRFSTGFYLLDPGTRYLSNGSATITAIR